MVLPASAAHDEVPPREADWIEELKLSLRLSRDAGILIHVDRAIPERLGELVRGLIQEHPGLDVHSNVQAAATVPEGSVMVLLPTAEQVGWLNMQRPIFAHKRLKVVLYCDHETTAVLAQRAPDFYDWISEHYDCPPAPAAHAVFGLRAANDSNAPGVIWRGTGDAVDTERLWSAFSTAFPGEKLTWINPKRNYEELVAAVRSADKTWIACRAQAASHVRRLRWAMAEAGKRGRAIVVSDEYPCPGWWPIHGRLSSFDEAHHTLGKAGSPRPGALAALTGLEPEALELARALLENGMRHEEVSDGLCNAQDPGAVLAQRAHDIGLIQLDKVVLYEAPPPALRAFTRDPEIERLRAARAAAIEKAFAKQEPVTAADIGFWAAVAPATRKLGDVRDANALAYVVEAGLRDPRKMRVADLVPRAVLVGEVDAAAVWYRHVDTVLDRFLFATRHPLTWLLRKLESWTSRKMAAVRVDAFSDDALDQLRQGDYTGAVRTLERFLSITQPALSDDHLSIRRATGLLGRAFAEQREDQKANTVLHQAVAVEGRVSGIETSAFASLVLDLAAVLARTGRPADAEALLRKLLAPDVPSVPGEEPAAGALGPSGNEEADEQLHLFLVQPSRPVLSGEARSAALRTLAEALITQGRYEEASEILADTLSSDHPERWRTLATHGRVLALQGRLDQAEETLREALALAVKHAGKHHIDAGRILLDLARVEHRLGRPDAPSTARRALDIHASAQIADTEKAAARSELAPLAAST